MTTIKLEASKSLTLWRCMRGYAHCDAALFRELKKPCGVRDDALVDEYIALGTYYREKISALRENRRSVQLFTLQKALVYLLMLVVGLAIISGVTEAAGLTHVWSSASQFIRGIFYYDYKNEQGKEQNPEDLREMWDTLLSDTASSDALTTPCPEQTLSFGSIEEAEEALGVKTGITSKMFEDAPLTAVTVQRGEGLHIHAEFKPENGGEYSYIGITVHITEDEYHSQIYVSGAGEPQNEIIAGTDSTYVQGDEDRVYIFSVRRDDKCYSYIVSSSLDVERDALREAVKTAVA